MTILSDKQRILINKLTHLDNKSSEASKNLDLCKNINMPSRICSYFRSINIIEHVSKEENEKQKENTKIKKTKDINVNNEHKESVVGHPVLERSDADVKSTKKRKLDLSTINLRHHVLIGELDSGKIKLYDKKRKIDNVKCGSISSFHSIIGGHLHLCRGCYEKKRTSIDYYRKEYSTLFDSEGLAPNYKSTTIKSLVRCRINYCELMGLEYGISTFDNPICFVLHWFNVLLGERTYTDRILSVIRRIRALVCSEPSFMMYVDDLMRELLSSLDEHNFLHMFEKTKVGMTSSLWFGLKNLGGPKTPSAVRVIESIRDWVSPKKEMHPFEMTKLSQWLGEWGMSIKHDHLSFSEFQTDPFRWATAGGAPRVSLKIPGYEKFEWRSKWAYAISKLSETSKIYDCALLEGNVAAVALKEEAKTRTVITTPMASYLRQSYILYLLGKPNFLSSTMANRSEYNKIRFTSGGTYLCVDASKFDHSVSKQFMAFFWNTLSSVFLTYGLVEAAEICVDECDSLNDLVIDYNKMKIKYEGGLLSGWRITTLIGSLKSALLCEYINHCLKKQYKYVVQGDDIMMLVDDIIDISNIKKLAEDLNITTNDEKTTSSTKGEFLKVQYDETKAVSYPVRSVRSIFYANPWLDTSIVKSPDQVASSWHGFYSRVSLMSECFLRPDVYYGHFVENMYGWLGATMSKEMITKLLSTPISLGGLACSEFYDPNSEHFIYEQILDKGVGGERWLLSFFGIDVEKTESKRFSVKKFEINDLKVIAPNRIKQADETLVPNRRDDCNIFKTSLEIVLHKMRSRLFQRIKDNCLGTTEKWIFDKAYLPKYLQFNGDWKQVFTFYNTPYTVSLPTSLFTQFDDNTILKNQLAMKLKTIMNNSLVKSKVLTHSFNVYIFSKWSSSFQRPFSM